MSSIPAIMGMDNYYKPFLDYIRALTPQDVGKKIYKVQPSYLPHGGMDCSYTGKSYTLKEVVSYHPCGNMFCGNKALHVCGACKQVYYCSRECQRGDWRSHRGECGTLVSKQRVSKMIITDSNEEHVFDSNSGARYMYGWVVLDEVKNIRPDTSVSAQHIDQLKRWEKGYD